MLTQFRHETTEVTVYPVLVGNNVALRAVPDTYTFTMKFFTASTLKTVTVESPILLEYIIRGATPFPDKIRNETIYYVDVKDLDLRRVCKPVRKFIPPPPLTFTTADVERQYVIRKYLQSF